jgi:hypothetical protein
VNADESHTVIEGGRGARPTDAVELGRGTILAGRYEIRRLLGRGGAGVVVQARDLLLGEDIAVKVLRAEHADDDRWIDRLAREVKLARQIRHANVCRVFDFGQADGHAFLVMELASAGSLRDELARGANATRKLHDRLADARAVADGLGAVHAAGILHRDVTTQNVLRMGDGRLVVSDFGLATDADPTANSLHGGTVTYMAPEIARGEPASVSSDVWGLGIVVHEIVFGRRPRWQEGRFVSSSPPTDELVTGRVERRILEICQRCTHERARLRPTAAEVGGLIGDAAELENPTTRHRRLRRAAAGLLVAAAAAGISARRLPRAHVARATEIAIAGEPADWSESARVLATVDGRVHALTRLPNTGRVRMTWGEPRRTEDVDLATGRREPAVLPLLPDRPGAPALSPDGASIAVEGYDAGGRPFIFLGSSARDARLGALTAAADPSMASEPRWLADGRAFVYDADVRNVGVFSLDTNRATILPPFEAGPSYTTFKATVADRILVARISDALTSQIALYAWPSTQVVSRFDLAAFAVEWQSADGRHLVGIVHENEREPVIVEVDTATRAARRLGGVTGQFIRALSLVGHTLVFSTYHFGGDVWIDDGEGGRVVTHGLAAREVARRGERVLVSSVRGGRERIVELDEHGAERGILTEGPRDEAPSILPSGREWTYLRRGGDAPGFYRCVFGGGCTRLSDTVMPFAAVSPDGTRIAYVDPAPQGPRARVVALAGGPSRDVGDASSYCRPVWSSAHTLWISRRGEGTPEWLEVDVDAHGSNAPSVKPTGRTLRGTRDCSDGQPDPAGPTSDGVKLVVDWRSELRTQPLP